MTIPAGPKGTRDFYPELMAIQEYIFNSWQKTCKRYSFESYEAPMFEHLEVFTQKSGAEIEKQLYTFEDKGNRMMALRPEMTPSLARMVAAKSRELPRPIRWYTIARLFRYEKMQKGRLREFFQLNMDILGSNEVLADAELIAAVIDMMRDLGLTEKDFQVRISSRTLLDECFTAMGITAEQRPPLYALLDRKNKISAGEYDTDLSSIIPEQAIRDRLLQLFKASSLDDVETCAGTIACIQLLRDLFSALNRYNMKAYACFDIGIVRGLAYYTGTVFEVFSIDKSMRAIAGGGRYDKLVELYGGQPTPAVGFAAGDVVLGDLLREKNLLPQPAPRCSVFIVALDSDGYDDCIPCAQLLREAGIACEFSFKLTAVGKQLKLADNIGAPLVVLAGGSEHGEGCYRVKVMASGEECTVAKNGLIANINFLLEKSQPRA